MSTFQVTASCSLRSAPGPTISVRKEWQQSDYVFVSISAGGVRPGVYLSPDDAILLSNEMQRLAAHIKALAPKPILTPAPDEPCSVCGGLVPRGFRCDHMGADILTTSREEAKS